MSYHPSQVTRTYPRNNAPNGPSPQTRGRTQRFTRHALSGVGPGNPLRRFNRQALGLYEDLGADCARTAVSVDGKSMECIDANDMVISSTPIQPSSTASGGGPSIASQIISGLFGPSTPAIPPGGFPPGYIPPPPSIMSSPMFLPLLIGGGVLVYMIAKK